MQTGFNEKHVHQQTHYFALVRRWWWLLVLFPLVAAGSAYWFSSNQPPTYEAAATLFISQASASSGDVSAAKQLAKTYSQLVLSQPVLEQAANQLHGARSVRQLETQVEAVPVRDTQIMRISTDDHDPQLAADMTNAVANTFVVWLAQQQSATLQQNTEALQTTLASAQRDIDQVSTELAALRLRPGVPTAEDAARVASLDQLFQQLQSRRAELTDLLQRAQFAPQNHLILTSPAMVPQTPDSPRPARNAALTLVLALALLVVGVVVFERLMDRLYRPTDVQRYVHLPTLGALPKVRRGPGLELLHAQHAATGEALRSLRTTVQLAAHGKELGALVITSARPGEGKSMLAANLAIALAQTGKRVVLVDGDLRQPYQHTLFAIQSPLGFADLLSQSSLPVKDALVEGPVSGLRLLLANAPVQHPAELLTGNRLKTIVAALKRQADVVVIDSPPLLAVSDALLLAGSADHALIVAAGGHTRAEDLRAAGAALAQTRVQVLGVVLNKVPHLPRLHAYVPYPALAATSAARVNGKHTVHTRSFDEEAN